MTQNGAPFVALYDMRAVTFVFICSYEKFSSSRFDELPPFIELLRAAEK